MSVYSSVIRRVVRGDTVTHRVREERGDTQDTQLNSATASTPIFVKFRVRWCLGRGQRWAVRVFRM